MFNKDNIERLMLSKGWTKYRLAKESGIAQSSMHDIISGRVKNPSIERLSKLATALGVSVNDFFDSAIPSDVVKESTIEKDFPLIPEHFTNPNMARAYVMKHQIFAASGFYPERMSDEDILNFANEIINQAELIGYKYKDK